ncbi:unnamed protein product [Schistosoma rodhaini]|uniref:Tctex1 domain-containing protein 1 n=1 Tax=Schistosoma mansoni TaxID=6183 RepID=A0A5K4F5G5_SCHMA|nr:unnamed protein product [Schistosoma rodhaini]
MNTSSTRLNSKSNELETVNEELIVKDINARTSTDDIFNQERNSRLHILSKAKGVKRLSLIKHSISEQSQPQTPVSCPNRSPISCLNASVNGPTSAVETNKILTFRDIDHPTVGITSRKISQNTQSSSSSLTSLINTNRPPLSLLGILAAKRITRKFLSTLTDEKHQRRLSTFSRLSSYSPASYNLINYLPTFQLGPKEIFNISSIKPRIEQLLESRIESLPLLYERFKANRLCITLTNEIKAMLKAHGEERYRYLVFCVVMQNCKQLSAFTSRVLWDMNYDRSFCINQTNTSYSISVNCFIVYKE